MLVLTLVSETFNSTLREQAYNRLTLAVGNLVITAAGIYIAVEGEPFYGGGVAVTTGALGILFGKLGIREYRESRGNP